MRHSPITPYSVSRSLQLNRSEDLKQYQIHSLLSAGPRDSVRTPDIYPRLTYQQQWHDVNAIRQTPNEYSKTAGMPTDHSAHQDFSTEDLMNPGKQHAFTDTSTTIYALGAELRPLSYSLQHEQEPAIALAFKHNAQRGVETQQSQLPRFTPNAHTGPQQTRQHLTAMLGQFLELHSNEMWCDADFDAFCQWLYQYLHTGIERLTCDVQTMHNVHVEDHHDMYVPAPPPILPDPRGHVLNGDEGVHEPRAHEEPLNEGHRTGESPSQKPRLKRQRGAVGTVIDIGVPVKKRNNPLACDLCHSKQVKCFVAPGQSDCMTCIKAREMYNGNDYHVVCEATRIVRKKGRKSNKEKAAMMQAAASLELPL